MRAPERATPLDRVRRYVSDRQQLGKPEESFASIAFGDLVALVTLVDVLKTDLADPALGWETAGIEAELYEREHKILEFVREAAKGTSMKNVFDAAYATTPDPLADGTRKDVVAQAREAVRMLALERVISSNRLGRIGDMKKEIRALKESGSPLGEKDEAVLHEDLEDLQNQREDLEQKLKLLERQLTEKDEIIIGLRMHGGEHWFSHGYQKVTNVMLGHWVDYCKVCDKPKDDPSHFGNGNKALPSTMVEQAVEVARKRLVEFLQRSGVRVTAKAAHEAALDLLGGLPGISLVPEIEQEDAERHCTCGAPESNHPFRHPFDPAP